MRTRNLYENVLTNFQIDLVFGFFTFSGRIYLHLPRNFVRGSARRWVYIIRGDDHSYCRHRDIRNEIRGKIIIFLFKIFLFVNHTRPCGSTFFLFIFPFGSPAAAGRTRNTLIVVREFSLGIPRERLARDIKPGTEG